MINTRPESTRAAGLPAGPVALLHVGPVPASLAGAGRQGGTLPACACRSLSAAARANRVAPPEPACRPAGSGNTTNSVRAGNSPDSRRHASCCLYMAAWRSSLAVRMQRSQPAGPSGRSEAAYFCQLLRWACWRKAASPASSICPSWAGIPETPAAQYKTTPGLSHLCQGRQVTRLGATRRLGSSPAGSSDNNTRPVKSMKRNG